MGIKFVVTVAVTIASGCISPSELPEANPVVAIETVAPAANAQTCGATQAVEDRSQRWPSTAPTNLQEPRLFAHQWDEFGDERRAIVAVDVAAGRRQIITEVRGFPAQFAASPDGRWLAFTQDPGSVPHDPLVSPAELTLTATDGSAAVQVRSSQMQISGLAWSPDSAHLLFANEGSLWRYDLADEAAEAISEIRGDATLGRYYRAGWSPAGDWIVHTSYLYSQLIRVRPDGSDRQLLAEAGDFAWAPDGHTLAISSFEGLGLAQMDSNSLEYVTSGPAGTPTWSPAGDAIAFYGDPAYGDGPLCVVSDDGSLRELATCTDPGWSTMAWSSDARWIAFPQRITPPGKCEQGNGETLSLLDLRDGTVSSLGDDLVFPVWTDGDGAGSS
jgi:Tol biopolymer transport system component